MTEQTQHFDDIIAATSTAPFIELLAASDSLDWHGIRLHVYRAHYLGTFVEGFAEHDTVILNLSPLLKMQQRFGGRKREAIFSPGMMSLTPKYERIGFYWGATTLSAAFHLDPAPLDLLIDEISHADPARIEMTNQFVIHDLFMEQLCNALTHELQSSGLGGRIFAETLTQALGLHLLRRYSTLFTAREVPAKRLSEQQMRQLNDYIHDHLSQSIGLAELAASIGLSASYFVRLFKQTTGLAPHQYLIRYRVERAKHLLTEGRYPIAEVAYLVGFTDQSHLTRHFKRLVGVTPRTVLINGKNILKIEPNIQD